MFTEKSRYSKVAVVETETPEGRTVKAVALRRLPEPKGTAVTVKSGERLDLTAHQRYADATRFWHIADANSELKAGDLVSEVGRVIAIPEK